MKILKNLLTLGLLLFAINSNSQQFVILDGTSNIGTISFTLSPYQTNYVNLTNNIFNTNTITLTNIVRTTNYVNLTNVVYITNGNPVVFQPIIIEAESGTVISPFIKTSTYISQSSETSISTAGKATYTFTIAESGNYLVNLLVNAPDEGANSLFVNIDATPTDPVSIFDIPTASTFQNRTVNWRGNGTYLASQFIPKVFTLSAGTHTLNIYGRERNVQIDKITITKQ